MAKKVLKKVCTCENCGNEGEMTITCSLEEVEVAEKKKINRKVKGTGVCTTCGNEADLWIDL